MTPKNRRQMNFVAETNVRLFDAVEPQRLVLDSRSDVFLRSLRESVDYDRAIYSSKLGMDEERFLDRMFAQAFDRQYLAAIWYSKIIGDLETTLCNTIPLTYPSTIFFASTSQVDALRDAFDRGTVLWDEEDRKAIVQNVSSVYAFLRVLEYGMQCLN